MTTPRENLLRALRMEECERIPWVPFVGCHAGALINKTPDVLLRSADCIVEGQKRAAELYKPDGLPVTFDLQIEAEALGCSLLWSTENPPAVVTHILEQGAALADLSLPGPDSGRIPVVFEAARRLRKELPDIALYGLATGPFTLALHLAGPNIFLQMFEDPDGVRALLDFCAQVARMMIDGYAGAGCDVIALVDPMTSQIGPDQFEEFVTPFVAPLFDHIRLRKCLGSFFVCGHAQKNIEAMCDCRPDNLSIDENIPLAYVRDICLPRHISFGGNLRLTTVLLMGTPEECAGHAAECMEVGGKRGFILAPGCDLPYATPPANLQAVSAIIPDDYRRQVSLELWRSRQEMEDEPLDLSEYDRTDKVFVDIITLDSESCAPCQYMVEAVRQAAPDLEGRLVWREHKIKNREGLRFMRGLFVRNVPTLCIDGEIRFISRIPPRHELVEALRERLREKQGGTTAK